MDTIDKLRNFITDVLAWDGPPAMLTDDFPLIKKGVIDSVAIFQIVTFLEDEYDIEIEDGELIADNFATLGSIVALVRTKEAA